MNEECVSAVADGHTPERDSHLRMQKPGDRSESHFPHQLGQSPSVLLMRIKPPDPQPCTYFISCHWNRGAHAPDPGLAVGENNLPRKQLSKNISWLQTNTKIFERNDLAKKLCLKHSKMILYFIKSRIFQIKLT